MMSEEKFDARLKHIAEQHAARRETADAYRDQEMAKLFEESAWTQEKIAERVTAVMGKKVSQPYVCRRLIFGRFLNFMPTGIITAPWLTGLTERRFRDQWMRTKGKEEERFAVVAHALEHGIAQGIQAIIDKPGILRAVTECLSDGKWYTVEQILATAETTLLGLTRVQVNAAIHHLRDRPPVGLLLETRNAGKLFQHRLAKAPVEAPGLTPEAVASLRDGVAPLLDELAEIGARSSLRISAGEIRIIETKLRRLFKQLLEEPSARPRGRAVSRGSSPPPLPAMVR